MEKLFVAGACSVYDLTGLKKAFEKSGYEVSFVDAPFMADIKIHDFPETEEIVYTARLPENCITVPLTEFWISYCIKNKCGLISGRALEASRSKRFLYDLTKEKSFDYPEIYETVQAAEKALDDGNRIIVKPEGLHSGYGIEVLGPDRRSFLAKYIEQAGNIKNRTLRLMEIENKGVMITEAVEGTEYSADCFFNKGRISIVRIARKIITVINDKPCAAAYILLKETDEEYVKYSDFLEKWTGMLFDREDISFAQFDFIASENGRVVPVDFASRVGGGIADLLIQSGENVYASAVAGEKVFLKEENEKLDQGNLIQLHYLPVVSGYIKNDDYPLFPGVTHIFKRKGDYVISNPSSVGSRIALTVVQYESIHKTENQLIDDLLLGTDYISTEK